MSGWLGRHWRVAMLMFIAFTVTGSRPWSEPYHPVDAMYYCILFVIAGYTAGYVSGNANGFREAGEILLDKRSPKR